MEKAAITRPMRGNTKVLGEDPVVEPVRAETGAHIRGIHHETHGSGPPILLTHGFGATCRMWDEQVEEFTDQFRTLPWDLPAHGRSAAPEPGGATPDRLVAVMRELLDVAEAPRAVLVGLGIGGVLSTRFWHAWPGRVRGLVLIGVIPGLGTAAARAIWNARIAALAAALERDGLEALEGGAETDPRAHASAAALAGVARELLTQSDAGALGWLGAIDVPVLVLAGGEDRPSLSAAAFMARTIPDAVQRVIPRANHAVNMHKPEAANAAIREFLARLPP
jgi:pimeloyl-ACP methyl ester carboxylesterase